MLNIISGNHYTNTIINIYMNVIKMRLDFTFSFIFFLIPSLCHGNSPDNIIISENNVGSSSGYNTIEGKVLPWNNIVGETLMTNFLTNTKVIVNYGEYFGFLKKDGSFEVTNLPAGSYLLEVSNADYFFEPIRVDINSKGKVRSRKVNYIQSSAVQQLPYPLRFKPKGPFKYFQVRESWRITDFLMNPMVLMMVLPLLLIMVLPKMMNAADPDTQREMNNIQMPKYEVPELSEMFTSFFTGGAKASGNTGRTKAIKKKQ